MWNYYAMTICKSATLLWFVFNIVMSDMTFDQPLGRFTLRRQLLEWTYRCTELPIVWLVLKWLRFNANWKFIIQDVSCRVNDIKFRRIRKILYQAIDKGGGRCSRIHQKWQWKAKSLREFHEIQCNLWKGSIFQLQSLKFKQFQGNRSW